MGNFIIPVIFFIAPFVFFYFAWKAHKKNAAKGEDIFAWGGIFAVTGICWLISIGVLGWNLGWWA